MRLILVAGSTRTAAVDGISAAGATPELRWHTPSADAELVRYGRLVRAPLLPTSPTGCPTPALVTRAVVELLGLDVVVCDGGLAKPTGAPTVGFGAKPGRDVRDADPVSTAPGAFAAAERFGRSLDEDHLVVGETIPGGTTTALSTMRALGESYPVSSSLPDNPLARKKEIAEAALSASDLDPGEAVHHPELAVRFAGDPVLAVVSGLCVGALDSGTRVTLAGGTQMVAASALVRHAGSVGPMELATTSYLADHVDLAPAARDLDLDLTVTDPEFADDRLAGYATVGREGAAMGGALALADRADVLDAVEGRTLALLDSLDASHGDSTVEEDDRGP
ncbi:nicotinate-nucleotide--dimethylbenzimidazole phosphoribosyltransferase [Salinigranum sp. GCM10025319]|uniref:nicotinate-nucleotide--dimethylbenzimidazole phosphoribosyltransferase n=1 Tax=Salinigranum sp. GCM10025319 TaxID=3252687 RepID=UPI00360BF5D8